jgi:uncharacterized protein YidB (DUF937 family)
MNLTQIATKILMQKLSGQSNASEGIIQTALQNLLPTNGGDLDVSSIVSQFMGNGGIASLAQSWLGDGENESLSPQNLLGMLGESKVSEFANQIGVDTGTAASGLSQMIPDLIDQSSSGGSLKENLTSSLVSGLASKLF